MRRRSGWSWTAWTRGPWPGPCSGRARRAARVAGHPRASVRGYRARQAAQHAKALARGRLRAVAVDGKTCRGARRAGGIRVHLLGVAEHGGRLLDHLEVDARHNETSHFTELLEPWDLAGAVVTTDALHTVRANLDWLVTGKKAEYIAIVKQNQPLLHAQVRALPWRQVPAGSATREKGHGRTETRTLKAAHVSGLDFPHARQAIKITRWRKDTGIQKSAWLLLCLCEQGRERGLAARALRDRPHGHRAWHRACRLCAAGDRRSFQTSLQLADGRKVIGGRPQDASEPTGRSCGRVVAAARRTICSRGGGHGPLPPVNASSGVNGV